jgi:competence protein ComEC
MRSWMIGLVVGVLSILAVPRLPPPWVGLLLAGLGLVLLLRRTARCRLIAGLALGCALALYQGQSLLTHRITEQCTGRSLGINGVVASLPRSSRFSSGEVRQRFELRVSGVEPAQCAGPRRILLSYYGPAKMIPGDRWLFPVILYRPWGLANPGSGNLQAWYASTGIDAVGRVSGGPGRRQAAAPTPRDYHNRLRQQISERVAALPLPADVTAILRALTVADKSGIDSRLWTLFQQYGLNHLLVISGLHIGLVAACAYLLGGLCQRLLLLGGVHTLWLPGALAMLCCTAYAALAGFSVATQRALLMLLCFAGAVLAGRRAGSAGNLLLAAAAVLAINPLAALGSGFWLSFLAVAALLWLALWRRGTGSPWQRPLLAHGFMSLVMLPLGAWWFGGASLVSALANLLMVPLVGIVIVPLALLAVLMSALAPGFDDLLWQLAAWPLARILPVAIGWAETAHGWLYQPLAPGLGEVLLAALGVLLLPIPLPRSARAVALLALLPLLLPSVDKPGEEGIESGSLQVTVLDVGQGTALVLQSGARTLVYDTGGGDPLGSNMGNAVLLPFLRSRGIHRIDTLVISHPDNDHSAGAATLMAAMSVEQVFLGAPLPALERGRPCLAGQAWRWPGEVRFQFLAPVAASMGASNDRSCVLQVEVAGHRLLLAGDIEAEQERELVRYWRQQLASDWLLVAHHGSRTSSTAALLRAVAPDFAVLSRGYGNHFGHPHAEVLARLRRAGARVYDTARGGALEFRFSPGRPIEVSQWRQRERRFWM